MSVYYLGARLGANYYSRVLLGAPLWQAPALSANTRLGSKWLTLANTLSYYDTTTITVIKCFFYYRPHFAFASLNKRDILVAECKEKTFYQVFETNCFSEFSNFGVLKENFVVKFILHFLGHRTFNSQPLLIPVPLFYQPFNHYGVLLNHSVYKLICSLE